MATAGKSGFNAEQFFKLVGHFRNANQYEKDNAFHLALAELKKAPASVFENVPGVREAFAELIGGAGTKEADELRRLLEDKSRELAQSRSQEARSRADAEQSKAEARQWQETIDRLHERIAELEADAARNPPAEDREPEPSPAPSPSSPPWYEDITPETEPEPADETGEGSPAWIDIPTWKALFWIALVLGAVSYAVLAAMIQRPLTGDDWGRLFFYWWSWLFIPAGLIVAGRAFYKFSGWFEDAVIIRFFPRLCLRIRALLVSPYFMLGGVFWLALLWACFVVGWSLKENRLPLGPLIVGVSALLGIYGMFEAGEDYENFGWGGVICKPCALIVWLAISAAVIVPVAMFFKLSVFWTIVPGGLAGFVGFVFLEDRLIAWVLADNRRFAGVVALAALVLVAAGIIARRSETRPAACNCPAPPQAAAPPPPATPPSRHAKPKHPARVSPEASQ